MNAGLVQIEHLPRTSGCDLLIHLVGRFLQVVAMPRQNKHHLQSVYLIITLKAMIMYKRMY